MEYTVQVRGITPQLFAGVHRQAKVGELSVVIPPACGVVWDFLRRAKITGSRNLVVYWDDVMNIDCGVEVANEFVGSETVKCLRIPAGSIAATTHVGPYDRLGAAHDAVHRWCKANGRTPIRPCWEMYGHWTDDVEKLETEVCYMLYPDGT